MNIDRRRALGLGGTAWVALASGVRATTLAPARITVTSQGRDDAGPALKALGDYAAAELAAWGVPGMTMAVRGADGLRATLVLGLADIERNLPVTPDQLFEIGSISKSMVALCIYRLVEQGRLRFADSVEAVLPGVILEQPATVAQLLEHSGGLAHDAPMFPRVTGGQLWQGFTPGSRFSYSNIGYDLLGAIVALVTGKSYAAAVTELMLVPLKLPMAQPVIRTADRGRYPIGYVPFRGDRGYFPGAPLAAGPWGDVDIPAGSIAATPADMLLYLDLFSRLSAEQGAGLFSDALARRYVSSTIDAPDFGPGARYASGLAVIDIDGRKCLHHTGGMIAFSSAITFDPLADGGVFVSTSIGGIDYRPRNITRYGCQLLAARASGQALPPPPAIHVQPPIEGAAAYCGGFAAMDGDTIVIDGDAGGLKLATPDGKGSLLAVGEGRFITDHQRLFGHEIAFDKGDASGLWWGGTRYGRDKPALTPPVAKGLQAFPGVYRSDDPWTGWMSVVARGSGLVLEGGGALTLASDGSWRLAASPCERLWFDAPLGGRMQRLNYSGADLLRFHDVG